MWTAIRPVVATGCGVTGESPKVGAAAHAGFPIHVQHKPELIIGTTDQCAANVGEFTPAVLSTALLDPFIAWMPHHSG